MLLSIDAPQSQFPNPNPVVLDEMDMFEGTQYPEHLITDDLPVAATAQKKGEMSKEGWEAWQMKEEELQELNDRWVYWMNHLQHTIRWYAWGDEDLTQIGIINLRRTLCEDINAPPNHLLHRAKMAIWMAASKGRSVDSPKSDRMNKRCRKGGIELLYTDGYRDPYDNPLLADGFNYPPDVLAIDKVVYENFRSDLTHEEAKLLDIMIEAKRNVQRCPPAHRKMFIRETGSTYTNYGLVMMSLLQKYYQHYGTKEQQDDFEEFYANWYPRKPMYHGRSRQLNSSA